MVAFNYLEIMFLSNNSFFSVFLPASVGICVLPPQGLLSSTTEDCVGVWQNDFLIRNNVTVPNFSVCAL